MAPALTALELVHMNGMQAMLTAKCREVHDDYRLSIGIDETGLKRLHTLFPISVCPALVAAQPPMCDSYHMGFF